MKHAALVTFAATLAAILPMQACALRAAPQIPPASVEVCGAPIQVNFGSGKLNLSRDKVLQWVRNSAESVATYYGRFPVNDMTVQINPRSGDSGVLSGRTWGYPHARTRIELGQNSSLDDLDTDWKMTHEMVHTAFPDQDDGHEWIEEGISVYVEPIARVQHGLLSQDQVWSDMLDNMSKGEPARGDRGLDRTQSWASTYWGGALFFFDADVTLRERTGNRRGLQDALRAIMAYKNVESDSTPQEAFAVGDRATGTTVLEDMYARMSNQPVSVELNGLFRKLGVAATSSGGVKYDDNAPDAAIRKAIFASHPVCSANSAMASRISTSGAGH